MSRTSYSRTGHQNAKILAQLARWAESEGTGAVFDASAGFRLAGSAIVAPDASWVRRSRLLAVPAEQRAKFLPLCPDLVVEVRAATDSLEELQGKMEQYMREGARLG